MMLELEKQKTPRRESRDDPFRRFHIAWRQPFKPTTTIVKVWDQATTRADPALILKGTAKYWTHAQLTVTNQTRLQSS